MFVLSNVIAGIARLIDTVAGLYFFVLIGYVICSWVRADPYQPIVRFITSVTEPVLAPLRRVIPPIAGIDFSTLAAILILQIGIREILVRSMLDFAGTLR